MGFFSSGPSLMEERAASPLPAALRAGVIYLLVGVVWILVSDGALQAWVGDPNRIASLQTAKGVVFVLLSAIVVFALVYRELGARLVSDRHIRLLADQDLAGVTIVGEDLRFVWANRRYAEIFGYDPLEFAGSSIAVEDLIAPVDREEVQENLRRRLDGEVDDVRYRYTGLRKDGETVRIEVHGRRIERNGEAAVMSLHLDVTEEERLRDQSRHSQRMEALGELTGAVSHDFNNLLTAIMVPLDLCEDRLDAVHPALKEVETAKESARRAQELTRQLLSFSRRRMYKVGPTDLSILVRRVHPMLRSLSDAGVALRMDLAEDLPAVEIDRSHFEQVLLNLVTNANAAVRGMGQIRIRTGVEAGDGTHPPEVILEVADDGIGMDEETCSRIFEPFFTTREEGTGLGLSTVHGIVAQAGGTISVESAPGRGSTFRIRLPTCEEEAEPFAEEGGSTRQQSSKSLEGVTILVVDDNDALRKVTARALERYGFATLQAPDGKRALALAAEFEGRLELALMDVGLPDINGVEVARRLRDELPGVDVVYMSGHSDEEVVDQMARERSSGFLEKPFSVEQLLAAVYAALGRDTGGDAGNRVS